MLQHEQTDLFDQFRTFALDFRECDGGGRHMPWVIPGVDAGGKGTKGTKDNGPYKRG